MPSLPAAHQLLPSLAYQKLGGAPIFEEDGYDYDGNRLDHESYDYDHVINFLDRKYPGTSPGTTADLFHSYTTANGAQDDWSTDTTGVEYFHFYGLQIGNKTLEKTVAKDSLLCQAVGTNGLLNCVSDNLLEPGFTVGDGTVPALSASRRGAIDYNARNAQVFRMTNSDPHLVEHTGLTQNPDVQNMVLTLVKGGTLPPSPFSVSRASAPDGQSSVPSFYVSIIGGASVVVSDTHGKSTAPILGDVLGTVPGVETFHMGDNAMQIALPVSVTENYSVTFNSTGQPIAIKVIKGVDNVTPTDVIRYQDLVLPAGVAAQLKVMTQGVQNLRYDADGNGTFETEVTPTIVVSDAGASDVTAPTISFSEMMQTSISQVTITAVDTGSGVRAVCYSTNGTNFQPYTGPVSLDPAQTPILYAFATDNIYNRSGLLIFRLTAPRVGVSGRVTTPDGRGLRNAMVVVTDSLGVRRTVMTNSFGLYSFDSIASGQTYTIGVVSKRFRFASRSLPVNDNVTNVDFVGIE